MGIKNYDEYVSEAFKPSVNTNHEQIVIDMLTMEYRNKNKSLMDALVGDDEKFFDNLAKDYAAYVTGAFGNSGENATIIKKAREACVKFKASVKLGILD